MKNKQLEYKKRVFVGGFIYKTKTLNGCPAKYYVQCYKDDVIFIIKYILSEKDISDIALKVKTMHGKHLWRSEMGFRMSTLGTLLYGIHEVYKHDKPEVPDPEEEIGK